MEISEMLWRLDRAVEKYIGDKRGYFSQRVGYKMSLEAIEEIAGNKAAEELFEWILDRIKEGRKPENKKVRKQAFSICVMKGIKVPEDSFLWT